MLIDMMLSDVVASLLITVLLLVSLAFAWHMVSK
jgi:hypothetical protein